MSWTTISKTADAQQLHSALAQLDINQQDERGRTPLMLLITNRRSAELVSVLLQHQPELEVSDKLGETALIKTIKFKQYELIPSLLQAGA
ncbi:ankyrin repeat domain-containing protein [Paenibacillus kandeliae]|uniref:ankyrin repeat domain-containing protein n=1 Tax=Paenibacillus kandeliae TaxID=3231269 RepID=UPI003459FCE3